MNRFVRKLTSALAFLCMASFATSCSMMEDDNSDCPQGLYVRFVYDYNTMRADMFKDHVGHVKLYIYDESGTKVAEREVSNKPGDEPLSRYGYAMHFTPDELPAGTYRLQAVAMQKDWNEALDTKGAKYRKGEVTHSESLSVTLDHNETPHPETGFNHVEHQGAPLDTLWHTLKVMSTAPQDGNRLPDMPRTTAPYSVYPLEEQLVTVENDRVTYATVSLIRDTKHLNITLRQIDDPSDMHSEDYEITITDRNATVGHDNAVSSCCHLLYSPFTDWTTKYDGNGVTVEKTRSDDGGMDLNVQRTAHYNVMFNRLMIDTKEGSNNAMLQIRNKRTGAKVATINLAYILSQGRTAYEYNYSPQEYLDREHDYHLDFILRGDKWQYIDIVINVLSWNMRLMNEEL